MENRISIPASFFDVHYVIGRIPGCDDYDDLKKGANCQLYAYTVLRYFGKNVPDLRSREMWSDVSYSKIVEKPEALDLMFYHKENNAYGAHVGVFIGGGEIIHLSKQNGKPEIISHNEMLKNSLYRCFIGAKRFMI